MATLQLKTNEQNFVNGLKKASGSVGELAGHLNVKLANSFKSADFYSKNFEKGIGRLSSAFKEAGQGMTLGLTLPLAFMAKSASDAYGEFDALRRALGTMEKTSVGLTSRLKELREVAKMPGIGFQEAIQGDVRLRSVGISAALSAKILREFANAVAMTGGGKAQLNEITVQLGQMAAKGKVLAQDLRPIIEAAPAVATALKNMFGTVSSEAISEQLEKTGKSSTDMITMLLAEMEKAPRVTGGWKNSLENLGDTLFVAKAEIFEVADKVFDLSGKLASVTSMVENFAKGFKELPEPMQKSIIGLVALVAILGPATYGLGLLTSAVASLVTATGVATVAIGSIVLLISSLAIAYGIAANEGSKIEKATQSLSTTYNDAKLSIKDETDKLQKNIEVLRDSKSSTEDMAKAKSSLIEMNPQFKSAIEGDIINFSLLADVASSTADELLRVAKYKKLISQKENAVNTLEDMGKGKLKGLSAKQLFAAGLVGDALSGGGSDKDAFKELKDENERKIRESIWFIDKTIEKEFGDLAKKNEKRSGDILPKVNIKGITGKSDTKSVEEELAEFLKVQEDSEERITQGIKKKGEDRADVIDAVNKLHEAKRNDGLVGLLQYYSRLAGIETITEQDTDQNKVYKELGLSTPDQVKEAFDKRISAMMEGQNKEIERRKKGNIDSAIEAERARQRMIEDVNDFSVDMMAGIAESIIAGDSFQAILKQSLTALGNFAIQLGKQYYTIAKLKEIITGGKLTPEAALGLIAGGVIVKGLASRMQVPKLAQGGMATNPTLAMIGDNKSGKEMVLPFERTGEFANMIASKMNGGGGEFIHTTRISGNDLLILTERAKRAR